jgi:hypothetical protein
MQPEHAYEVGYGRPPVHTRFRTGQSGNPKGRPNGAKSVATSVDEALNERVSVTENGKRRKISKRQAMFTQLANRAAQGDHKATQLLLGYLQDVERRAGTAGEPAALNDADRQVLELIRDRLDGTQGGSDEQR